MSAMRESLLECEFHEFLCWRRHILESLAERHNRKAHTLEVLHHLYSSPAVEGYLSDIVLLTKLFYELLNVAVVDYVAFCCFKISLSMPYIVRDMVSVNTEHKIVLGIQKNGMM